MNKRIALWSALAASFLSSVAAAARPGFAVLELFTSEGCSSCPSADRLLSAMIAEAEKAGKPVYALSFHVDYWNYLGWKDPFSRMEYTERQQDYARALDSRVYTPQLVVNGGSEFVGSDSRRAREEVKDALAGEAPAAVEAQAAWQGPGKVRVSLRLSGKDLDAVLQVALVEKGISVPVRRGENGGRTLEHENVVRNFASVKSGANGEAAVILDVPEGARKGNLSVIAFAQERGSKTVTAAASARIRP